MFRTNRNDDRLRNGAAATPSNASAAESVSSNPLHRIAQVRRCQGVSLRQANRFLGMTNDEVKQHENGHYDLMLSELYAWQRLLNVPLSELLMEPESTLSSPLLERAALVRVMKTAVSILDNARKPNIRALASTLIGQLVDIMPELEKVQPWHSVGQRRTLEDLGRVADHPIRLSDLVE